MNPAGRSAWPLAPGSAYDSIITTLCELCQLSFFQKLWKRLCLCLAGGRKGSRRSSTWPWWAIISLMILCPSFSSNSGQFIPVSASRFDQPQRKHFSPRNTARAWFPLAGYQEAAGGSHFAVRLAQGNSDICTEWPENKMLVCKLTFGWNRPDLGIRSNLVSILSEALSQFVKWKSYCGGFGIELERWQTPVLKKSTVTLISPAIF